MRNYTTQVVILAGALALVSCAEPAARAVFAVPSYKTLQGDIAGDLSIPEITDGEPLNTEGNVDLKIAARYKDGTVVEQSVIDQIRECGETVCTAEIILLPGTQVLFDAVATRGDTMVRRGVTTATLLEGEQTDVLLTMWPTTRHAGVGPVTHLDTVRGDASLGIIVEFDTEIDEPAFTANNAQLGGMLALDFGSDFTAVSGALAQRLDPESATHLILLNGTPAGSYFPLLPSKQGTLTVQGQSAALLSYQIYGKIVVLTLPYEAVDNRDVVLAGSLVGHLSVGDADPVRVPAEGSLLLK